MNTLIESTNTNQVLNDSRITTEILTTDQEASNDEIVINGQSVTVDGITANYDNRESGLYYVECPNEDERNQDIKISAPLYVPKFVKNDRTNEWSRQFLFRDFFNEWQKITIPFGEISGKPKRLEQILSNGGLDIEADQTQRLYDYVISCKPINPLIMVDKTGWHGEEYVMPECPDSVQDGRYIYQAPSRSKNLYQTVGTLSCWKSNVASMCIDNSRLLFSVSAAFGAILLPLVGGNSCGFHLSAKSSRGKTTILRLAKSVTGDPKDLLSWRTTDNAFEESLVEQNHSLACTDELGQLPSSKIGDVSYLIGNERGRGRYKQVAEHHSWKLFCLSTGESTIREELAKSKKPAYAGQENRFIDIAADTDSGHGVFNVVHDYGDGGVFADELNHNVEQYHGTAGRAFIKELSENKDDWVAIAQGLRRDFLTSLGLSAADAQVRRVAGHFATIVAAGELASQLSITGWPEGQAAWAGEDCFKSWLEVRGGDNAQEADVAVTTVQNKLIQFGHSKFITEENPTPRGQYWGRKVGSSYFIFVHIFNEQICKGMNSRSVKSELVRLGHITPANDGRTDKLKRIDGKPTRCIHINETLFAATTEENISIDEIEA